VEVPSVPAAFPAISLPAELGEIREIIPVQNPRASSSPLIIHIQDAHANPAAQKNICALIEHFNKALDIDLVFVEGAASRLDRKYLKFSGDSEINQKVAGKLAQMGELSGPDLYLLKNQNPTVEFIGIENSELYAKNLEQFRSIVSRSEESKSWVDAESSHLDREASRLNNKELLTLIRQFLHLEFGKSDLKKIVSLIDTLTQKQLARNLRDVKEQMEFPNLVRLLRLMDEEGKINLEAAKKEAEEIEHLLSSRRKPGSGVFEMILDPGFRRDDKNPRFLLELLYASLKPQGFDFSKYPNFSRLAKNRVYQYELKSEGLFRETKRQIFTLFDALAKTEGDKALVKEVKNFALMSKLITLELTREEWLVIASEAKQSRFGDCFASLAMTAFSFYESACAREAAFVSRIQEVMKQKKKSKALVITGGFHSDGLSAAFQSSRIQHAVVSPRVEGDSRQTYLNSVLENYGKNLETSQVRAPEWAIPFDEQARFLANENARQEFVRKLILASSPARGPDSRFEIPQWVPDAVSDAASLGAEEVDKSSRTMDEVLAGSFQKGEFHRGSSNTKAIYITTFAGEVRDREGPHTFFPEGSEVTALNWDMLLRSHREGGDPVVLGLHYLNIPPPKKIFRYPSQEESRGYVDLTKRISENLADVYFGMRLYDDEHDAARTVQTGFEMDPEILEVIQEVSPRIKQDNHIKEKKRIKKFRKKVLLNLANELEKIHPTGKWKSFLHLRQNPYLLVRYTSYYVDLYEIRVFLKALKKLKEFKANGYGHVLLMTQLRGETPKQVEEALKALELVQSDLAVNFANFQEVKNDKGKVVGYNLADLHFDAANMVTVINMPNLPTLEFKRLLMTSDTAVVAGHMGFNEVVAMSGIEDMRVGPLVTLWYPQDPTLGDRFSQWLKKAAPEEQLDRINRELISPFKALFDLRMTPGESRESVREREVRELARVFFDRDTRIRYRQNMRRIANHQLWRSASATIRNGMNAVTQILFELNKDGKLKEILENQDVRLVNPDISDNEYYYVDPIFRPDIGRHIDIYVSFWARSGYGDVERFLHVMYALNQRGVVPYVILDDPDPKWLAVALDRLTRRLDKLSPKDRPRMNFLIRTLNEDGSRAYQKVKPIGELGKLVLGSGEQANGASLGRLDEAREVREKAEKIRSNGKHEGKSLGIDLNTATAEELVPVVAGIIGDPSRGKKTIGSSLGTRRAGESERARAALKRSEAPIYWGHLWNHIWGRLNSDLHIKIWQSIRKKLHEEHGVSLVHALDLADSGLKSELASGRRRFYVPDREEKKSLEIRKRTQSARLYAKNDKKLIVADFGLNPFGLFWDESVRELLGEKEADGLALWIIRSVLLRKSFGAGGWSRSESQRLAQLAREEAMNPTDWRLLWEWIWRSASGTEQDKIWKEIEEKIAEDFGAKIVLAGSVRNWELKKNISDQLKTTRAVLMNGDFRPASGRYRRASERLPAEPRFTIVLEYMALDPVEVFDSAALDPLFASGKTRPGFYDWLMRTVIRHDRRVDGASLGIDPERFSQVTAMKPELFEQALAAANPNNPLAGMGKLIRWAAAIQADLDRADEVFQKILSKKKQGKFNGFSFRLEGTQVKVLKRPEEIERKNRELHKMADALFSNLRHRWRRERALAAINAVWELSNFSTWSSGVVSVQRISQHLVSNDARMALQASVEEAGFFSSAQADGFITAQKKPLGEFRKKLKVYQEEAGLLEDFSSRSGRSLGESQPESKLVRISIRDLKKQLIFTGALTAFVTFILAFPETFHEIFFQIRPLSPTFYFHEFLHGSWEVDNLNVPNWAKTMIQFPPIHAVLSLMQKFGHFINHLAVEAASGLMGQRGYAEKGKFVSYILPNVVDMILGVMSLRISDKLHAVSFENEKWQRFFRNASYAFFILAVGYFTFSGVYFMSDTMGFEKSLHGGDYSGFSNFFFGLEPSGFRTLLSGVMVFSFGFFFVDGIRFVRQKFYARKNKSDFKVLAAAAPIFVTSFLALAIPTLRAMQKNDRSQTAETEAPAPQIVDGRSLGELTPNLRQLAEAKDIQGILKQSVSELGIAAVAVTFLEKRFNKSPVLIEDIAFVMLPGILMPKPDLMQITSGIGPIRFREIQQQLGEIARLLSGRQAGPVNFEVGEETVAEPAPVEEKSDSGPDSARVKFQNSMKLKKTEGGDARSLGLVQLGHIIEGWESVNRLTENILYPEDIRVLGKAEFSRLITANSLGQKSLKNDSNVAAVVTKDFLVKNPSLIAGLQPEDKIFVFGSKTDSAVLKTIFESARTRRVHIEMIDAFSVRAAELNKRLREEKNIFSIELLLKDSSAIPQAVKNMLRFKWDDAALTHENLARDGMTKQQVFAKIRKFLMATNADRRRGLMLEEGINPKGGYWFLDREFLVKLEEITLKAKSDALFKMAA